MPVVSDDRKEMPTAQSGAARTPSSVTNFFAVIAVTVFLLIVLELISFVYAEHITGVTRIEHPKFLIRQEADGILSENVCAESDCSKKE